jgi:hypothetical protein
MLYRYPIDVLLKIGIRQALAGHIYPVGHRQAYLRSGFDASAEKYFG